MPHAQHHLPPSADFWPRLAANLAGPEGFLTRHGHPERSDFSAVRILVPSFTQAQQLRAALMMRITGSFIPPRITTLSAWLDAMPPDASSPAVAPASERMMGLYAELRQHAWLKKLFTAKRNTDLMPLAQTLLGLFDELSRALVPTIHASPDMLDARWHAALEHMPAPSRSLLSDEAQLVWTLWKSQLATGDAVAACFAQLMRLAARARGPLVWIHACEPDPYHQAFLDAYAAHSPLLRVALDWRAPAIAPVFAAAWPEIVAGDEPASGAVSQPANVVLAAAGGLEQEALQGAQTVIDWLQAGRGPIAIVAQDRAVARRIRALLERADVVVTDETGWKLSTTRAAAAVASLLDLVAARAETPALLDLLKSPYVFADEPGKMEQVMLIEHALRRHNIHGGWEAVARAVKDQAAASALIERLSAEASRFAGRMPLADWVALSAGAIDALGMRDALAADSAGVQVIALLDALGEDCRALTQTFSLSEWRAFLGLRLEATPFVPADFDRRVLMLQLNGMQLRAFDAVLLVGADAAHLPSQLEETLFFGNAVRRELGLPTREQRQCQQLRDFAEMLSGAGQVVLSWQLARNGEPNPVSGWLQRLQLALESRGQPGLGPHRAELPVQTLSWAPPRRPAPAAPHLLPSSLSASAYNSLVACPYQFFARRMLGLGTLGELSDMPEKRDYGEWLHDILHDYHQALRDRRVAMDDREPLLRAISEGVFARSLDQSAAALGYYARWQKIIPAYLDWANAREAEGWTFLDGEKTFQKIISWDGGKVTLYGCIDRIDENEAGERAILDYKTRDVQSLKARMKEGEDHQLAFYALLSDRPVSAGHVVALEASKNKTGDVAADNFGEWQRQLEGQIVGIMRDIAGGKPLSAMGIERVCVYCDVRGLCRKGAWE
ncbi:PD-(D/E)XK nuclease family protein [Noviherbaspirillum galbum]|uniref:PD-(D/E)XK nuclease family protein n=1 Tax=Noviherbaspirillum galbum TaxID=2709383 RepID=A0A6B3SSI0_9BURK|nr:PD-(D/E)XK nuclease family protein [Noviherbaspirillum galbum]NEX60559.1 PD-(D/E)XK nuclease family protein [Noviherbaspirillum galbum]